MLEENNIYSIIFKIMAYTIHLFAMDIAEMIKPVDYKGASIYMELVWII